MPGVTVGEMAVLGTRTLAQQGACFPPDSISTGAVGGRSVLLRTEASAHAPPKDRAEELRVMRMLESPAQWLAFNLVQLLSGFVAYALPQFAWVIATEVVFTIEALLSEESHVGVEHMHGASAAGLSTSHRSAAEMASDYWAVWVVAYFAIEVSLLLLAVAMKWAVVGEYREENHTFFSNFHYRWAVMLNFKGAMAPLGDNLSGTAFQAWYMHTYIFIY